MRFGTARSTLLIILGFVSFFLVLAAYCTTSELTVVVVHTARETSVVVRLAAAAQAGTVISGADAQKEYWPWEDDCF